MALRPKAPGIIDTEERGPLARPAFDAGNEQTFVSCLIIAKEPHRSTRARPGTGFLALTFGTLLSSQGTDAHQSGSLDPSWGNRSTLCLRALPVKAENMP